VKYLRIFSKQNKISVSENGENFAFFLERDNERKLYVTKMVEFNAPYGNIESSDRNTPSIRDVADNKFLMSFDLESINITDGK